MKKLKAVSLVIAVAVIALELLPFGAVLKFAGDPEAEITLRYTYSYFDPTPYGYANFGPFITAILSCVILVLTLIALIKKQSRGLSLAQLVISTLSLLTSVMPLIFGIDYFTPTAVCISLLIAANAVIFASVMRKQKEV